MMSGYESKKLRPRWSADAGWFSVLPWQLRRLRAVRRNAIMTWNSALEVFFCVGIGVLIMKLWWETIGKPILGTVNSYWKSRIWVHINSIQHLHTCRWRNRPKASGLSFTSFSRRQLTSSSHEDFVLSCCKELADAACHRSKLRVTSRGHVWCMSGASLWMQSSTIWQVDSRFWKLFPPGMGYH